MHCASSILEAHPVLLIVNMERGRFTRARKTVGVCCTFGISIMNGHRLSATEVSNALTVKRERPNCAIVPGALLRLSEGPVLTICFDFRKVSDFATLRPCIPMKVFSL